MSTDYLPVAFRAFTEANQLNRRRWRKPRLLLVLDTETATDFGQALLFGCARVYRLDKHGPYLIEEGESLFHADDLAERDPVGYQRLLAYAERQGIRLRSRRGFVKEVLWPIGYEARAWIVGFNLPFDLSRLAVGCNLPARAGSRGFSLILWDYFDQKSGQWTASRFRPLIMIEPIDNKRAITRFSRVEDPRGDYLIPEDDPYAKPNPKYTFPGNFLDLRTLGYALTGESHSLASACETFRVKHPKRKAEKHGVITARYVDYCRRDVLATSELAFALLEEYERHPIGLRPTQARSPASIAKAYLDAMAILPFLQRHPVASRQLLGDAMVAYIGGRVETRLRRQLVPVVYVDFLSMYPTVNANMGLWRFFTAERIETSDATAEARALVHRVELDDLFERDCWRELPILCLVEADGEVLPARAMYERGGAWQIGVNPLHSRMPVWMTLADAVAAKLLGGNAPRILEAVGLTPVGLQRFLRPARLLGEIEVDPARDDFFRVIVEERERLKHLPDLPESEREWRRRLLKVIVNAASYGITAEMNETRLGSATTPVTVYGLGEPFKQPLHAVEQPGRYCFPPLAAFITGAARLMLAMLERCVTDLGGSHVMADTDSMAIVASDHDGLIPCNGGPHCFPDGAQAVLALSYAQVDEIVERFRSLSPYDPGLIGSILKIEEVYTGPDGERLQLQAHSISAKRYALLTPDGQA
jgi:hypothetical protein